MGHQTWFGREGASLLTKIGSVSHMCPELRTLRQVCIALLIKLVIFNLWN